MSCLSNGATKFTNRKTENFRAYLFDWHTKRISNLYENISVKYICPLNSQMNFNEEILLV